MTDKTSDDYPVQPSASLSGEMRRVLKEGDTFAIFDSRADIQQEGAREQGIFHRGTRHLSVCRLEISGRAPVLLSSAVDRDNLLVVADLTNADEWDGASVAIKSGTLHVRRSKVLWQGGCYERLIFSNFGQKEYDARLEFQFEADFVDVFEVRGQTRERRGTLREPEVGACSVTLSYEGLDSVVRRTHLRFSPEPKRLDSGAAEFAISLPPQQSREIHVDITCVDEDEEIRDHVGFEDASAMAEDRRQATIREHCRIETTNEQFNDWLNRSGADLNMMITRTPHGLYPYAGVPWFSTVFGRDGILTALSYLWVRPDLAEGVLRYLAATQATEMDDARDAEPGKIVHELRDGEMAALREIPFGRYYGSIDSTPLFVMLAAATFEATNDRGLLEEIWPNVLRALEWIDRYGDADGDGFVEYGRMSSNGLQQQGWKDSNDSIFHQDGSAARGPIALCEVQGYVHAAKLGAAAMARALGFQERGDQLAEEARVLRERFDVAFWCPELNAYALALDGGKRPCRVVTSNAGQCLFTGIALPKRAGRVAATMLSPEMFAGWGVRTLSSREQRYNPMSYHNGSIWPHDNALVAEGLARYGFTELASRILQGLFDASLFTELHRLPELFCGFARRDSTGPTLYPVACSPQSWAAATPFALLRAVLGLQIDASAQCIRFDHPHLPPFLNRVFITNLRVGSARVDLDLERRSEDVSIHVRRKSGPVEIIVFR